MQAPEQLLDDLAGAVLDGTDVDWAAAEAGLDRESQPLIRHLQLVASVARLHRDLLPTETDTWPLQSAGAGEEHAQWGHFRLEERIGHGAFGDVYRAWDMRLDREVALKLLPAPRDSGTNAEATFIREGRLLARVRHPNVVTIYDARKIGNQIGLWMELIRGQTLAQRVATGGPLHPSDVTRIGAELCRAAGAVHAAGLLHRDIKGQNVMLADDGRVVLMDFGAGRELAESVVPDMTGTPLYLAPEVLGRGPASIRSDVYSIGVMLYFLATGTFPVRGRTIHELRAAHARGERAAVRAVRPQIGAALARVIDRATDPDPDRRHADANDLARDLLAARRAAAMARVRGVLVGVAILFASVFVASEIRARFDSGHRPLRTRLAGLIVGTPDPLSRPVIAVLPFRNLGREPGSDLLVDGISTELIRELSVIDGLQARSREASFRFKDAPQDLTAVGRLLGVNLIVDGDVLVAHGSVVIRASLLSVETGATEWSDTFNRRLGSERDVAEVVEDITRRIVTQLRLKVGRTQRRYDTSIETLTKYFKARALRDARGPRVTEAIQLFEEVIREDPTYAPAMAALAALYGEHTITYPMTGGGSVSPAQAMTLMEPLILKALAIDTQLAEAHAAMGHMHSMSSRWGAAEASFRRAIGLDPSLTALYGDFVVSTLVPSNRVMESIDVLEAALRGDSFSLDLRRVLAHSQVSAGLYDEAIENCRRVMDIDPNYPFAWTIGARAQVAKGRIDQALDWMRGRPLDRIEGWLGYIYAISGRRAEAEAIAAKSGALPQRQAMIYAGLGEKDRAFDALERLAALNPRHALMYLTYPELASLRGDPRVTQIRQRYGLPQ